MRERETSTFLIFTFLFICIRILIKLSYDIFFLSSIFKVYIIRKKYFRIRDKEEEEEIKKITSNFLKEQTLIGEKRFIICEQFNLSTWIWFYFRQKGQSHDSAHYLFRDTWSDRSGVIGYAGFDGRRTEVKNAAVRSSLAAAARDITSRESSLSPLYSPLGHSSHRYRCYEGVVEGWKSTLIVRSVSIVHRDTLNLLTILDSGSFCLEKN